ncbi:MAG TPA: oligosaccharide flippase family protein, partial [Opitutaceae bacterium]
MARTFAIPWKDRLKRSGNLVSLLGAQGVGLVSGLFFAMATARKLSALDFGQFAIWQALLGYLTVCAEFGTAHAATRRIAAGAHRPAGSLFKAVIVLRALGFLIGFILVSALFLTKTSSTVNAYWLAGFACLGLLLVFNFEWFHLGQHHEPVVARARVGRHLALFAASLIILRIGLDGRVVVGLYVFAATIQSGLALAREPKTTSPFAFIVVSDLARECWPLVVALLAQQWVW